MFAEKNGAAVNVSAALTAKAVTAAVKNSKRLFEKKRRFVILALENLI